MAATTARPVRRTERTERAGPLNELSFPAAEFEQRLAAIRGRMKSAGFDALVIPAQGEPRLMTRSLEREIAKLQWTGSPQLYADHENPYEALVRILQE